MKVLLQNSRQGLKAEISSSKGHLSFNRLLLSLRFVRNLASQEKQIPERDA